VSDVAKHVNRRTIAVYASAPTWVSTALVCVGFWFTVCVHCVARFSHGVVDDIEGLAAFTESKRIGLHVDNCLGGFVLSHLRLAGKFAREFDFTVRVV
jgi:glutamate/tyrosine decarboxylase-like PLP-dependent enzyme